MSISEITSVCIRAYVHVYEDTDFESLIIIGQQTLAFFDAFYWVVVWMSHCTNSNMLSAFLFCQRIFNKYPCVHAYDCIFLVCRVCVFAHSLWGLGPSINITEGKTSLPLVRPCTNVLRCRSNMCIFLHMFFLSVNMRGALICIRIYVFMYAYELLSIC